METKYVRIPFDLELAKKITSGEVEGKVVTRDGRSVRIICWDALRLDNLVVLINEGHIEKNYNYTSDGRVYTNDETSLDLMIEIPAYYPYEDGDIICLKSGDIAIVKGKPFIGKEGLTMFMNTYIILRVNSLYTDAVIDLAYSRKATEEEINKLKDKMQKSDDAHLIPLYKRFFGFKKTKYEFKPFDKVLVRNFEGGPWAADIFSNIDTDGSYICVGGIKSYCIPYNEETAHLLGTTENYK